MKARSGSILFLPAALLLLALLLACRQADATPKPEPAATVAPAVQAAKPLTLGEREAVDEFAKQQRSINEQRENFYKEFDDWRAGLTECHPIAAQEALQGFAASFKDVARQVRNLPGSTTTRKLDDWLITAAEAEETAYRQLRDHWQPTNVSLFEAVELRRSEAARARKDAEGRSLELQEEFEEGPTAKEVEEIEEFSETFEDIEDAWDDFHDAYIALRQKERTLETAGLIAGYDSLAMQLGGIIEIMDGLEPTDDTEDFIEALREAAIIELGALEDLSKALSLASASPPSGEGAEIENHGEAGVDQTPPPPPDDGELPPAQAGGEIDLGAFQNALDAAFTESETTLDKVNEEVKTIVDGKSAQYLEDVNDFNAAYLKLVARWDAFHDGYDEWRKTDGGCDRAETLEELGGFSQDMADLGRQVRAMPQSGFLLPVYTLLAEAAEREEKAMRALYNSWRPFTVDAFIAVDGERANAALLRRQANIGLQELRDRQ